jgi:hypothetical protein
METDAIQSALNSAFWAALLLGCDVPTTEAAVLDGIGACEGMSRRTLLIEAVRSTLQRRASSTDTTDAGQLLPAELLRLFRLQPRSRDCFVLRILLGISPDVCAGLLNISVTEFADAFCAALNQLPLLFSPNVDFGGNQSHPMSAGGRSQNGRRKANDRGST